MVYSFGLREGLLLRFYDRRKLFFDCICDFLGIVLMEQNIVWVNECIGGILKVYE